MADRWRLSRAESGATRHKRVAVDLHLEGGFTCEATCLPAAQVSLELVSPLEVKSERGVGVSSLRETSEKWTSPDHALRLRAGDQVGSVWKSGRAATMGGMFWFAQDLKGPSNFSWLTSVTDGMNKPSKHRSLKIITALREDENSRKLIRK
jgi:hypothetical protein